MATLAGDCGGGFEGLHIEAAAGITVKAGIFNTYFPKPLAPPDIAGIDDAQAQQVFRFVQSADAVGKAGCSIGV